MAVKFFSWLFGKANTIRQATVDKENTAERVGEWLVELLTSSILVWDAGTSYKDGQFVFFEGVLSECVQNTTAGQSPVTHKAKWKQYIISAIENVTINNSLPVSGSVLYQVIQNFIAANASNIPNATETVYGKVRKSTDEEFTIGENNTAYVTPDQVYRSQQTLLDIFEDLTAATLPILTDRATKIEQRNFIETILRSAEGDQTIADLLCDLVRLANCYEGGGSVKTLDYVRVTGPDSIPKTATGTFVGKAFYTDGSTVDAPAGGVFSIQGIDATINPTTGVVRGGPGAVVGGAYTVTFTFGGKSYSKGTTFTAVDSLIPLTKSGPVTYFDPVVLNQKNYMGSLDVVNCVKITGWTVDRNAPNDRVGGRLYIDGIFIGLVEPTVSRPDVSTDLQLNNTTGHIYGWERNVPNEFRTGKSLTVELRPISGTNVMRNSPKQSETSCFDPTLLINVVAGKQFTTTDLVENGYGLEHLTDDLTTGHFFSSACLTVDSTFQIKIDTGGTSKPQEIELFPRNGDPGAMPVNYYIDGSENNVDWFRLVTVNGQPATAGKVVLAVEKSATGEYRTVRYARMTVTKLGNAFNDCPRFQLAEFRLLAPSFTPIDSPPPTRQPARLEIIGDAGLKEGESTPEIVWLFYTSGQPEPVTNLATRNTGTDFSLSWNDQGILSAATNNTVGDTRTSTLTASYAGLTTSKQVTVYDVAAAPFVTGAKMNVSGEQVEGGGSVTLSIELLYNNGSKQPYTGAGGYSIYAPYPNGMTVSTGQNASGTITLPANSITADLVSKIKFTFPAGFAVASVDGDVQLRNVNEAGINPPPVVANPVSDQNVTAAGDHVFNLPGNQFYDPGDIKQISVAMADGSALPAYITYTETNFNITVAANAPNGTYVIRVKDTDSVGQSVYDEIVIVVNRQASPPTPIVSKVWFKLIGVDSSNKYSFAVVAKATGGMEYYIDQDGTLASWVGTIVPTTLDAPTTSTSGSYITGRNVSTHTPLTFRLRVQGQPQTEVSQSINFQTDARFADGDWVLIHNV